MLKIQLKYDTSYVCIDVECHIIKLHHHLTSIKLIMQHVVAQQINLQTILSSAAENFISYFYYVGKTCFHLTTLMNAAISTKRKWNCAGVILPLIVLPSFACGFRPNDTLSTTPTTVTKDPHQN